MARSSTAASMGFLLTSLIGLIGLIVAPLAMTSAIAQDTAAPEATPAATETKKENAPAPLAIAEASTDPRAAMPVFKVWQRHSDHGGSFIQIGDGGEILPIEELPKIISLDHDPEIEQQLKKYRRWKKLSLGATVISVGAGVGAFTMWWMSVSNHESSSSSAFMLFAVALAGIGGRTYAENLADQALYRAQAIHNNRILERKPPKTSSLTPQTLTPIASFTFDFPYLGGGK